VVLAVRPEDLHMDRHFLAEHQDAVLHAEVRIVEPMGHEKVVSLNLGSTPVTARTSNDWSGVRGQGVPLAVDLERAILFDPSTEQAVGMSTTAH
ncbi:sugar ABC transporter ATP-binding protein, partial [mine drainage metagenome]